MAMKAYKSYKDTEYDWLPRIPTHWTRHSVREITSVSSERNENAFSRNDLLSVYREYGVIKKFSRDDNHNVESLDLSKYKTVHKNYLVINKMKMWQGSLGISKYDGIVSPAYIVCKLNLANVNYQFIHALLRAATFKTFYNRISYGVRVGQWDASYEDLKPLNLYLPPKEEQDQIVRYLDWQNSRLNKLINAKKKEIALLEEQKQALISQAVTKGLDPHSPLKDSGIDWIGQIPEHWEIRRLKSMLKSPLEYGANMSGIPYDSSLPRYIRITDIETSTTLKSDNKLSLPISDLTSRYLLKTGDVLFARSGATVAKTYIVSENDLPAAYAGYLIKCCANEKYLLPLFLLFYSQSHPYTLWKDAIFIQATIQNISAEKYNNLQLPVPSVTEQTEICEYLARKSSYFDNIIKIKAKTISLLQEYRTRLVADVVTGQIDVRHITIPNYETVPETIDQPETAEESAISAEDQ